MIGLGDGKPRLASSVASAGRRFVLWVVFDQAAQEFIAGIAGSRSSQSYLLPVHAVGGPCSRCVYGSTDRKEAPATGKVTGASQRGVVTEAVVLSAPAPQ